MNHYLTNMIYILPVLMLLFGLGWLYCFRQKLFAWLDFFWSTSFILIIIFNNYLKFYQLGRISITIIELLYVVWSLRLSTHLFKRIKKHGEDRRYLELKKKWKVWYGLYFFIVFEIEAILALILSIPIFLNYESGALSSVQYLSMFIFAIALTGEYFADRQLQVFTQTNQSKMEVCKLGLWKYSRHPNYFFEWMVWISFSVYALSSVEKWPGLLPACIMYVLLTKVTGIPPAEASSLKSKGEKYMIYQKETNAFFPWSPRKLIIIFVMSIFITNQDAAMASGVNMPQTDKIKHVFNHLRIDNMQILDDFYAKNAEFVDPLGEHYGAESIKKYYQNLYQNVTDIHFDFKDVVSNHNHHVLFWQMSLKADGLNGGKTVTVDGNSHIKFNDNNLVIYHRDYFDMGEFIYEHIPFLGWTLKQIKNKLRGK